MTGRRLLRMDPENSQVPLRSPETGLCVQAGYHEPGPNYYYSPRLASPRLASIALPACPLRVISTWNNIYVTYVFPRAL